MKFAIEPKIFEKFPGVQISVIVITGMDNHGHNQEILSLLRSEEAHQKQILTGIELGTLPEISVWRQIYKDFGSGGKDYRSSVEALLRRARGGEKPLPQINNLVDLYNYLSLKYHLPAGAEDIDKVEGDISLAFSNGIEKGIYIGSDKEESCNNGEVIYKDQMGFICRRWNWREADRTKIDFETVNAVLAIEKAPGLDETAFQVSLQEAVELIRKYLQGKCQIFVLSGGTPSLETEFKTGKKKKETKSQVKGVVKAVIKKTTSQAPKFPKIITDDPQSIAFQLRYLIWMAVKEVLGETGEKTPFSAIFIEHPINKGYGDYSSNIAMIMAKRLKMKPIVLAEKLKRKIDEYIGQDQTIAVKADSFVPSDLSISPKSILENVNVAGCGFLNLVVATSCLISQMERVLDMKYPVITSQMRDRKIAVEYTDPNPFKEFHLGHMYSNFIGEAIARLFEACGATVWRGDFYGDVGMHIAKSVYGLLAKFKDPASTAKRGEQSSKIKNLQGKEYIDELKQYVSKLGKLPISERQKLLGEGYALGTIKYDEEKQVQEEVKEINSLIYVAAQEILKKDKGWQPIIDYRQYVQGKEGRLEEVREVYGAGLKWSLEYFETIYKRLGTKFDGYYPESWVGEYGMKLVEKGLKMGVLEKSEGGVVYRGEQDGLHTRVFVNKLGLPTYEAKDLGLAMAKYQDFKYDLSINVFGKEIDEYYKVVKAAMKKIEPELGEKAYHIAHGMVRLPEGKMSSRSGNVITFEWLLGEAKKRVLEIIEKTDRKAESLKNTSKVEKKRPSLLLRGGEIKKEIGEIAEKVAIGAVRYALLKNNIGNDIVFDFGKSVSFEGDSGPYLMYTYARCKSVLRKAEKVGVTPPKPPLKVRGGGGGVIDYNPEELALLRLFYRFPEVVADAAATFSPHLLCAYLFELAQCYSLFYQKHTILDREPKTEDRGQKTEDRRQKVTSSNSAMKQFNNETIVSFRLALTQTTANLIKRGLFVLGIETVEKM